MQEQHDGVGCGGVEAGGRFVEEEEGRRHEQLHPDVGSLSLAARNAADDLRPDLHRAEDRQPDFQIDEFWNAVMLHLGT